MAHKCTQKENPVCLKCSGKHRVDECDSQELRCANCGEEHKSSSSECNVLSSIRKKIKEAEADFQLYKAKEFFVNVEMFKIMNNDVAPTSDQI